jgi:hypothetical protein
MAFEGQGQGWVESFYWQSVDGDLNAAEYIITPIAQARARLLANTYILSVVRNSQVIGTDGKKVLRVTDLFEPRLPGVSSWAPATPNMCCLLSWQNATNTSSKKQYMRGIPAGLGDLGKAVDIGYASWVSNFNNWRSKLIALPAGWLASAATQNAVISSYTVDPVTAQVTFALQTPGFNPWPVAFGLPTRVYVKLPGKNPMDGPLAVIPTSATSCFTVGSHPAAPLPTGQIGSMSIRSPSFVSLATLNSQGATGQIHPQRIISHKTGRPTYASRGRASKKVLW